MGHYIKEFDMPINNGNVNDKKMKELILYIAQKSEGDNAFGATKLNKLLFFSDFLAYLNFGKSISEQEYQCLERCPAPRRLIPIREKLISEKKAVIRKSDYFNLTQDKLIALENPDIKDFTAEEIALVDSVIQRWWGVNASEISAISHNFIGWICTNETETIPYETALIGTRELTQDEIDYAKNIPIDSIPVPVDQFLPA